MPHAVAIKPVHPATSATGWFRYQLNDSTGAPDTDVADGIYLGDVDTVLTNPPIDMTGWQGLAIVPFAVGAENDTFTITLQHVERVAGKTDHVSAGSGSGFQTQYVVKDFTVLTCTLALGETGQLNGYIPDTALMCDTITQAKTTFGTQAESAFEKASRLYSPVGPNVVPAMYWIPDFADAQFAHLLFDITGGAGPSVTSANALIKLFSG